MRTTVFRSVFLSFAAMAVLSLSCGAVFAEEQTLRESVLSSLRYNPQVKALQNAREAAGHDYRQAKGGFFPRIDASTQYGAEQYNDSATRRRGHEDNYYGQFDASLTVTQMLYDGHATESRLGVADASLESARSQFIDGSESVALDAVIAHLNVYRQRLLVDLAEQNIEEHQTILGFMQERQEMGAGSLADVTQTRGRLARAMTTLSSTRSDLRTAVANYVRLTGTEPDELEFGELPMTVPADVDTAAAQAQDNNPQIATLTAEMNAADQRIGVNEAAYMPRVNLVGATAYSDQATSSRSYTSQNELKLTMDWNLYRGGSDVAAVRAAKARKLRSRQDLQNTRDAIMEEVVSTWSQYKAAMEQVALYEEAVEFNRQTRDMYRQQFNVGQRSLLDVLDAENELFNTQGQLASVRVNVLIGGYRLLALGGRLLDGLEISDADFDTLPEKE